jgi:hypothetical protein
MDEQRMDEEKLDGVLGELVRDYNAPPATPREEMWARIEAARRAERAAPAAEPQAAPAARPDIVPIGRPVRRRVQWAAGIAALLALGIGIGRMTAPGASGGDASWGSASTVASGPNGAQGTSAAHRVALTQYLGQSEAFLTLFRASVRSGRTEELTVRTARQLLSTNRLLLDSPAANDARSRMLLEDLELVLAQIAQLSAASDRGELRLVDEGLEQGGVLPRLRTAVPSGPAVTLN